MPPRGRQDRKDAFGLRGKVLVANAGHGLSINGRDRAALQRSAHVHEFQREALFERHFLKVVVLQASSNSSYPSVGGIWAACLEGLPMA